MNCRLFLFLVLFPFSAIAGSVVVADPTQLYTTYYRVPDVATLPSPPMPVASGPVIKDIVQVSPTPAQSSAMTVNNPRGFVPVISATGEPVLRSTMPIVAPAVITAVEVPPPTAAAANTMAGTVPQKADLVRNVALGAGAGSAAAVLGKGLLAGAKFIPAVGLALTAAQVGYMGYSLYQDLSASGVTVLADGSAMISTAGSVESVSPVSTTARWMVYYGSWQVATAAPSPEASCRLFDDAQAWLAYDSVVDNGSVWNCRMRILSSGVLSDFPTTNLGGTGICPEASPPYSYTVSNGTCVRTVPGTVAASEADLIAALTAVTLSANAIKDIADLYLKTAGKPLPDLPVVQDAPVQVGSPWKSTEKKTDNLGNTTETLTRNVTNITSGPTINSPTTVTTNNQTVTVFNSTPTTVSTSPLPPTAIIAGGIPKPGDPSDLCTMHPEILACADITKLNDLPAVEVPNKDITLGTLSPVSVGSVGFCPPPLTIPGMFGGPPMVFSIWQPACDFAGLIKGLNIAAAGLFSLFILTGNKNG